MGCKFNIECYGNIGEIYNQALKEIPNYDISLTGNSSGGNFKLVLLGGTFLGSYRVSGNIIHWEISKKPFYVSCFIIESFLRNYLS